MAAFALGELPALPLHEAGKYVAGAYVVAFVIVLVYVTIVGIRLSHIERRLGELLDEESRAPGEALDAPREESPREESALEESSREESTLV